MPSDRPAVNEERGGRVAAPPAFREECLRPAIDYAPRMVRAATDVQTQTGPAEGAGPLLRNTLILDAGYRGARRLKSRRRACCRAANALNGSSIGGLGFSCIA